MFQCVLLSFENIRKYIACRVTITMAMQEAVNNYITGMTIFNFINFTEAHNEAHLAINVTLSSLTLPHCIICHQGRLIRCFDPVCPHVPTDDGDDDRCFKWHFSANNLLSYWFPTQISCSAVFQRMDFVPCCPSLHSSSFLLIEKFNIMLSGLILPFFVLHISQSTGFALACIKTL